MKKLLPKLYIKGIGENNENGDIPVGNKQVIIGNKQVIIGNKQGIIGNKQGTIGNRDIPTRSVGVHKKKRRGLSSAK